MVAKNYLAAEEIETLNRLVSAYLEFAELQASNRRPMHMADWIRKLDDYLKLSEHDVLTHAGSVSRESAAQQAQRELDRYDAERAKLPSPAEAHFEDAVREVQALAKKRPARHPAAKKRGG